MSKVIKLNCQGICGGMMVLNATIIYNCNCEGTTIRSVTRLHSKGGLLAVPTNSKLGSKKLKVPNTLAYNSKESFMAVKNTVHA